MDTARGLWHRMAVRGTFMDTSEPLCIDVHLGSQPAFDLGALGTPPGALLVLEDAIILYERGDSVSRAIDAVARPLGSMLRPLLRGLGWDVLRPRWDPDGSLQFLSPLAKERLYDCVPLGRFANDDRLKIQIVGEAYHLDNGDISADFTVGSAKRTLDFTLSAHYGAEAS